jgi:hypothetical protein
MRLLFNPLKYKRDARAYLILRDVIDFPSGFNQTLLESLSEGMVASQVLDGHTEGFLIIVQAGIIVLEEFMLNRCVMKGRGNYLNELSLFLGLSVGVQGVIVGLLHELHCLLYV